MKRDNDLIRQILLNCEANDGPVIWVSDVNADEEGEYYDFDSVTTEHFVLLKEAGFISEKYSLRSDLRPVQYGYRLTWVGYDYLDAIRDEGIWKKTKDAVSETGGSATLEILKALALGFVKKKLSQHTGIDL